MKTQMFKIDPHPAIPPADLLKEWEDLWHDELEHADVLLIKAFQAGADQELEACCEWLEKNQGPNRWEIPASLRTARRPKPLSLAEVALKAIDPIIDGTYELRDIYSIRAALERLQQLESNQ